MTATTWASILNTAALVLQLVGAALVALDVKQSQDNTTHFKEALDHADETRRNHIADLDRPPGSIASPFGGSIRLPQIAQSARGQLADQLGPSAMEERKALTAFVRAQYEVSKPRRWIGVVLLVVGIAAGYAGNMIAL
ncbi:hypothetical protein [Gordonia sp. DT101]|uniref:hypothetical protein n=1 Tax=Gordonia sp. DT101 TaxID=3416545 RepID=UPI003CE760F1